MSINSDTMSIVKQISDIICNTVDNSYNIKYSMEISQFVNEHVYVNYFIFDKSLNQYYKPITEKIEQIPDISVSFSYATYDYTDSSALVIRFIPYEN